MTVGLAATGVILLTFGLPARFDDLSAIVSPGDPVLIPGLTPELEAGSLSRLGPAEAEALDPHIAGRKQVVRQYRNRFLPNTFRSIFFRFIIELLLHPTHRPCLSPNNTKQVVQRRIRVPAQEYW
ncbi:MAG TPA: hypothetical protein VMN57_12930 [Anaerolineales bacterium]|nr:hypothetical protein [Anaerolineales bacterium]